jgi:hypothetical protein
MQSLVSETSWISNFEKQEVVQVFYYTTILLTSSFFINNMKGNHDYGYGSTGTEAQIAMTDESEYWSFPDYCYMKTFPFQGGQIGIVFTDTVTLAPDGMYR